MEWLILALLVPAIVVPVVLLWGFCGCSVLFEPSPPTLAFEASLTPGPAEIDLHECCVVQRIEPAKLLRDGTTVKLTLRGSPAHGLSLARVFISQAADTGDPYDSRPEDLTPVAESVLLPANSSVTLEVGYELDPMRALLVAIDVGRALNFGARVRVIDGMAVDGTTALRVHATPSGTEVGTQPLGAEGVMINGPVQAASRPWVEVNFDSGVDGWVQERRLSGERLLAFAGDVYRTTSVPATDAAAFHREDVAEAAVPDRQPSYTSLGSIYLLERIDAES